MSAMNKQFYFGGTVLTMEDRQPYAEAVLVEDGKIAAVGSCEELMDAAAGAELVDLKGGVLMPGFIDAHSHFTSYALSLLQPSVEEEFFDLLLKSGKICYAVFRGTGSADGAGTLQPVRGGMPFAF